MNNSENLNQFFEIGNKEKDLLEQRLRELVKPPRETREQRQSTLLEPFAHLWSANYRHGDTRVYIRVHDPKFNFEENPPLAMHTNDFITLLITQPVAKKDKGVTTHIQTRIALNPYTRHISHHEESLDLNKKGKSTKEQAERTRVENLPSIASGNMYQLEKKLGLHTVTYDKFEEVMQVLGELEPKKENKVITIFKRFKGGSE